MRAATRTGIVFVGGSIGSASRQQSAEERFVPRAIAPDRNAQKMRRELRAAVTGLAERYESLRQTAEDATEIAFWQARLDKLKGQEP